MERFPVIANDIPTAHHPEAARFSLRHRSLWLVPVLLIIAFGLYNAWSLRYVNDDAFISFRYAKNVVEGKGWVYNAGERVEGYTNFLWTALMASGMELHIDPVAFSTTLGIACYGLVLLLFAIAGGVFRTANPPPPYALPLTVIALSVHRDFNVYATSGLETSLYTLLVSAAFLSILYISSTRGRILSGLLLCLAMMTRPDGVIFFVAALVYLAFFQEHGLKQCIALSIPIAVIFLPYWLWRWTYFGMFFPNSFYAKSVDLPYYSQGLRYLWMYVKTYYIVAAVIPLGIIVAAKSGQFTSQRKVTTWFFTRPEKPILLSTLFILSYTAFVVRVGGDFMFARFLIPVTPMIFFLLEKLSHRLGSRVWVPVVCAAIITATAFRWDQFAGWNYDVISKIVDEHQLYTAEHLRKAEAEGEQLKKYFEGYNVRVAFTGTMARVIYYADVPYAIEATTGLTDAYIAHLPLGERGRPGHEKTAPWEYLISRNVNFLFTLIRQPDTLSQRYINFGGVPAQIVTYDDTLMEHLATFPEIRFVRITEYRHHYTARTTDQLAPPHAETPRLRVMLKRFCSASIPGLEPGQIPNKSVSE